MKRKLYMTPQTEVIEMKNCQPLLAGSDIVNTINTGTDIGIDFGGGGTGPATSRELQDLQDFMNQMGV